MKAEVSTDDPTKIEADRLQIEAEPIGEGSFGTVYKGFLDRDIPVAVKKIIKKASSAKTVIDAFETEVKILNKLKHENIVFFFGITEDFGIVSQYCPNGDLFKVIHKQKRVFTIPEVIRITTGIAKGIAYLHSKRTFHRDIKSHNILLDANDNPKITDFGLSKTKTTTMSYTRQAAGTPNWMAPEVLRGEDHNIKVDFYSFALVIYEMLSGLIPFEGCDHPSLYKRVGLSGERPDIPERTPPNLQRVVQTCWSQNPAERPMMKDVILHLEQPDQYPLIITPITFPEEDLCQICKGERKSIMFVQCNHFSCYKCSVDTKKCPLCDKVIIHKHKITQDTSSSNSNKS
eukprot:TRINITY_DN2813_c0_g1_i1.p1 TRINITY_DN2813_c0_g1~~TRINITY_DN2813_c0_g1_i1.p1  ORF type:complete len:345 (+),score=80.20 TRINITY_DN2813_c0_g1_i1:112-1146(+)